VPEERPGEGIRIGAVHNSADHVQGGPLQQIGYAAHVEVHQALPPAPVELEGLPPEPERLVGRAGALAELLGHLDPGRSKDPIAPPAFITGQGGVGKSALALAAAHEGQRRGWFPGGVLYYPAGAHRPGGPPGEAALLTDLLRLLGVPHERTAQYVGGLRAQLLNVLEERRRARGRVLVLLDDLAPDLDGADVLVPVGPGNSLLVTGRARPKGGARLVVGLGTLTLEESRTVLCAQQGRAKASGASPSAADADELAALVGHLPLALTVIAARLAEDDESPAQLLAALRHRADGPAELDIESTFDWSLRTLPPPDARLTVLLGLYPGRILDAPTTAALGGLSTAEARRALRRLRRFHIVEQARDADAFAFHDLMRAFLAERAAALPPAERARALTRLTAHCRTSLGTLGPHQLDDRRRMLTEVVRTACREQLWAESRALGVPLADALARRAHVEETILVRHALVTGARQQGEVAAEADLLLDLADSYHEWGNARAFDTCIARSLRIHSTHALRPRRILDTLGRISATEGDSHRAALQFRAAARAWARHGNRSAAARSLSWYAVFRLESSERHHRKAAHALARARKLAAGDAQAGAAVHLALAFVAARRRDASTARAHADEAVRLASRAGAVVEQIEALMLRAKYASLNPPEEAPVPEGRLRLAAELADRRRMPQLYSEVLLTRSRFVETLAAAGPRDGELRDASTAEAARLRASAEAIRAEAKARSRTVPPPFGPEPGNPRFGCSSALRTFALPALLACRLVVVAAITLWAGADTPLAAGVLLAGAALNCRSCERHWAWGAARANRVTVWAGFGGLVVTVPSALAPGTLAPAWTFAAFCFLVYTQQIAHELHNTRSYLWTGSFR
jgi:hypothetical protein